MFGQARPHCSRAKIVHYAPPSSHLLAASNQYRLIRLLSI